MCKLSAINGQYQLGNTNSPTIGLPALTLPVVHCPLLVYTFTHFHIKGFGIARRREFLYNTETFLKLEERDADYKA